MTREENTRTIEWSYTKLAYAMDVEMVIWPMVSIVKAQNIWTLDELKDAVLHGKVLDWPKVSKKGLKGLFAVLRNHCGVSAADLMKAAKVYTGPVYYNVQRSWGGREYENIDCWLENLGAAVDSLNNEYEIAQTADLPVTFRIVMVNEDGDEIRIVE